MTIRPYSGLPKDESLFPTVCCVTALVLRCVWYTGERSTSQYNTYTTAHTSTPNKTIPPAHTDFVPLVYTATSSSSTRTATSYAGRHSHQPSLIKQHQATTSITRIATTNYLLNLTLVVQYYACGTPTVLATGVWAIIIVILLACLLERIIQ